MTFVEQAQVDNLEARLLLAKVSIAGLVQACKMAYLAQLHPRSAVALALLKEIHRHEPGWKAPETSLIGRDPARR